MASSRTAQSDEQQQAAAKEQRTAKQKRPNYSWAQPVCQACWNGLQLKTGRPTANSDGTAICCFCSAVSPEGDSIFLLRTNPGAVPYPSLIKDE